MFLRNSLNFNNCELWNGLLDHNPPVTLCNNLYHTKYVIEKNKVSKILTRL